MRLVERGHAVAGDTDVVALHPQRALQHLGDRVVVLDDQHAGRALKIGGVVICEPDGKPEMRLRRAGLFKHSLNVALSRVFAAVDVDAAAAREAAQA